MNRYLSALIIIALLTSCVGGRVTKKKNSAKENFHVYLLMGQSNMAGRGKIEAIDTLTHSRVFMLNIDTAWVPATNPIHFDKPTIVGTGLGMTFGKIMAEENSNIKIGIVPCAKGGSSINQWFRDSLHIQTNSYPYNEMIFKAKKAMETGTIKGILWHQGESDTKTMADINNYKSKFNALLDSIGNDLNINPVPVVIGEIGYFFYQKNPLAEDLNIQLEQIANSNNCIGLVKSDNLNHKGDTTHFDSKAYRLLGMRYAEKMKILQSECHTKAVDQL